MSGATFELDAHELDELREKLEASPRPVLKSISADLVGAVRRNITSGSFAPLSEATLAVRRSRGITSTAPLQSTGKMLASLRGRATSTTAAAGVAFPGFLMEYGGFKTGGKSAIPGRDVPARSFAFLTDADQEAAMDKIEAFYLD